MTLNSALQGVPPQPLYLCWGPSSAQALNQPSRICSLAFWFWWYIFGFFGSPFIIVGWSCLLTGTLFHVSFIWCDCSHCSPLQRISYIVHLLNDLPSLCVLGSRQHFSWGVENNALLKPRCSHHPGSLLSQWPGSYRQGMGPRSCLFFMKLVHLSWISASQIDAAHCWFPRLWKSWFGQVLVDFTPEFPEMCTLPFFWELSRI